MLVSDVVCMSSHAFRTIMLSHVAFSSSSGRSCCSRGLLCSHSSKSRPPAAAVAYLTMRCSSTSRPWLGSGLGLGPGLGFGLGFTS